MAAQESFKLAETFEPPLQRKKRVNGPPVSFSVDFYNKGDVVDDDYALLGQQDKFAPSIQYRPRRNGYYIKNREASPPKQQKMEKEKKESRKLKPPPIIDTSKYTKPEKPKKVSKSEKTEKTKKMSNVSIQKNSQDSVIPVTPLAPRGPKNYQEPELKAALKDKNLSDVLGEKVAKTKHNMNEFSQTDMAKGVTQSGPEAPAEYVMKYKAGIVPPRPSKKMSEYQREFEWKNAFKSSPLLAAQDMLYYDRVGPGKTISIPKTTEYAAQFKPWMCGDQLAPKSQQTPDDPKKKKTKVRRSKSVGAPASRPAAGSDPVTRQFTSEPDKESHPVPKPEPFHGKLRKVTTEYRSNFKSPVMCCYDKGVWKGADPPQLLSQKKDDNKENDIKVSNWFAEVVELREKAAEYKKRAQGTHFSREHLVQLLAKQTNYWDLPSARRSSTLSALSLELGTGSIVEQMRKKEQSRETKLATDFDSCRATMADSSPGDIDDQSSAYPDRKTAWEESSADIIERENDDDISSVTPDDCGYKQEGRLPTPELRSEEQPVKARHHLALTTPAVGGAILSSPPPKKVSAWSAESDDSFDSEEYRKAGRAYRLRKLNPSPTCGLPSLDTHVLRDDYSASDLPLRTHFVHSPVKDLLEDSQDEIENYPSQKKSRDRPHFIPPTINEQMGETYNKPMNFLDQAAEKDDDVLSVSARSIASSCSLVTDLYERSKQRRDNFWAKGVATR